MTRVFSISGWLTGAAVMLACAAAVAAQPAGQAQQPSGQAQQPTGAMQGLAGNRDQPVKITSNTLEVRDKIHQATFSGDVKMVQGDTTITCRALTVFYEDAALAKKGAAPEVAGQKQQNTQIKRAEAKGDVLIVQKDQTASGENGVYDIKSNTMTLTGNVVVTQGASVMRGERMVVNMATGVTTVDASKGGRGQIEFLTTPGAAKDGKGPPAPPAAASQTPAPAPATKSSPKGPMRIN